MPVSTLNVTQRVIARTSVAIQNKKAISTCVDQSPHMPAIIQKAYQHAKSNPLICQRGHKMNHNMYVLTKHSPVREAGYSSQHVLTKLLPCEREHKMYVYINLCNESIDIKHISTCVDQTPTMPARTQKGFQLV